MTFKHTKFEDSITMRALEKVAKEKGMFKEQPLDKYASMKKKADLSVTGNLIKNILNLSAGLREAGFDKRAEELETTFLNYKQADTMYEVSGEKGEDLIDAAHPKGSHKLENVDSAEALVETIIDQHLKNVKIVNKMPTGKLTNAADIINAVKMVLGQTAVPTEDDAFDELRKQYAQQTIAPIGALLTAANKIIVEKTKSAPFMKNSWGRNYNEAVEEYNKIMASTSNITTDLVQGLATDLHDLHKAVSYFTSKAFLDILAPVLGPAMLVQHLGDAVDTALGGFQLDIKDKVATKIVEAIKKAEYALAITQNEHDEDIKASEKKKADSMVTNLTALDKNIETSMARLNDYLDKINHSAHLPATKQTAANIVDGIMTIFNEVGAEVERAVPTTKNTKPTVITPARYNEIMTKYRAAQNDALDFYNKWVKPLP